MSYVFQTELPRDLREHQQSIAKHAADFGLDFYPTLFEVLPYDRMNEIAAYGGFPTRYPHWRFGMEYERLSKSHEYGLSKIYEMVINNTPAVAYLLEGNTLVDQKLVMAHVYGHVDFFKNNFAFAITNQGRDPKDGADVRKWVDTLANHGAIVRKWTRRLGAEAVESFIDACLSLENLIDPQQPFLPTATHVAPSDLGGAEADDAALMEPHLLPVHRDYMKGFINPEEFVQAQRDKLTAERDQKRKTPESPERDVLGFLLEHAPLQPWERDVLSVVRREAYYFLPQMQTKIMNEGWATYWHSRLMTERVADGNEIVDYAERTASVLATSKGNINPYKLGIELYRNIVSRWDRGQFGKEWDECDDYDERRHWDRRVGQGQKKIFEVRSLYNDVTFVDEFLTEDFVADQQLFTFGWNRRNDRYEVQTREFETVKSQLLAQLTNAGNPIISVLDSNHDNRGELLLQHDHHGVDLKLEWVREVMKALHRVWRRPVELHTVVEKKPSALRWDGNAYVQRALGKAV
jgi:stage V sporulation protein R